VMAVEVGMRRGIRRGERRIESYCVLLNYPVEHRGDNAYLEFELDKPVFDNYFIRSTFERSRVVVGSSFSRPAPGENILQANFPLTSR